MQSFVSTYGRVMDLLPELILIVDGGGTIVDSNNAASEAFGLPRSETTPVTIDSIVAPSVDSAMLATMRSSTVPRGEETQFVRSDGSVIDVKFEIKSMPGPKDAFRVLIAHDITLEKKRELDLLRFSNVIEQTINPIQITDALGKMVYVNPAFEKASGYSKEELIGQNPHIFASGRHAPEFWSGMWKHILSGKVWIGRVENQRKDGLPFHSELVISPIIEASGAVVGFLGAHRDITEQIILEEQLVRSQRMESIGTLAAGIAHEVGNPLTAISSLVQVLQRNVQDQFASDKLSLINSQISRIAKIIRDLVDFSRPSTHIAKPTNLNQILTDALNIVKYGKKVKDITFELMLQETLPSIRVVPDQIVQVFINILMNAVDSLDGNSGKIVLVSRATDFSIEVDISDSGNGISEDAVEKIFEPFYTTKGVGKGTGLGLWVSYGIVKSFDGTIDVSSEPGKGSRFTVRLPRT